ncbi:hypothetical protein [Gracilinema caldarium]|uniref:hypothetical protein n=1 Tax=Gracilinema caldarium TaxID=215591 RepID=UPI0026EB9A6D|nr:hypothetical protein [Gracilinema caldarium]
MKYILMKVRAPAASTGFINTLRLAALAVGAGLVLAGCSVVFTSSINGRVIDKEERENNNNVVGVSDARVYLYTDQAAWEADYNAYVEGNTTTLPDAPDRRPYRYFQSTTTDNNGNYQFAGVVWETMNSAYGKTADRKEVYILVYHPNYGLWKNPNPYIVVSDVTTEFPPMEIEDLYNEGRLSGRVLNWKDGKALANAGVNIYVPKKWSYTSDDKVDEASLEFPTTAAYSVNTDNDGYWTATIRYKKMGGHEDRVNKTRVRVAWNTADYRAGPSLNGTAVSGDRDLDGNGRTALEGDTNDWYLLSDDIPASTSSDPQTVNTGEITLQRYRFTVNVSGRVLDADDATGKTGINGARVVLTVPSPGGTEFDAYSQTRDTQNSTEEGYFNLGTLEWFVEDIAGEAYQKTGTVSVDTKVYLDGTSKPINSGSITTLKPDTAVYLNLKVTP